MKFNFQLSLSCGSYTSFISVTVLGSHDSKKSSVTEKYSLECVFVYNFFSPNVNLPDISMMVRVFANGLRDLGSVPGCHTKDSKNGT